MMDKTSLVKVFLHDRGEDVESAWCQPAGQERGAALFRLVNVPFLHAKPTYGDVIPAFRDDHFDGNWAWDRDGVPFSRIGERLQSDGERYALIVDYTMRTDADFGALVAALERQHGIVAEGCFGPRGEEPGRLYLAAQRALAPAEVMAAVTRLGRGFRFALVHPLPPKKKPAAKGGSPTKKAAGGAKPAGAKPAPGAKKPAPGAKKPAPGVKKPGAKKPGAKKATGAKAAVGVKAAVGAKAPAGGKRAKQASPKRPSAKRRAAKGPARPRR